MNAKSIVTALSLAVAGSVAFASEASDAPVPVSTLERAEVRAAIGEQRAVENVGEATVFADAPAATRAREEVREEARAAARNRTFDELLAG
jgi:hypothetical protein